MMQNHVIYSDDPQAVEKLQAKLDKLTAMHARMKEINAYGGYDHQGTGLLQKAAKRDRTLNLPPRGKSAHWTSYVPGPVLPLPPLHTSPPSYRLYRLKKRFPYKSISYRKQHPFSDGAFYFYS